MTQFAVPYQHFLEVDCRYRPETVRSYLESLPGIIRNMQVSSIDDIDERRVAQAWQNYRWRVVDNGIELADENPEGYLGALKAFLNYLESSGQAAVEGLSEAIGLPAAPRPPLAGLNAKELKALKRHLLFNLKDDEQRRDTALMLLLLSAPISLEEALSLEVHQDGSIHPELESGSFIFNRGACTVRIEARKSSASRVVQISVEALRYLNFYLENRPERSARLFIRHRGRTPGAALTRKAALALLGSLLTAAGIKLRQELVEPVTRETAKWELRRHRSDDLAAFMRLIPQQEQEQPPADIQGVELQFPGHRLAG